MKNADLSLLSGNNILYLEEMHEQFKKDPASVDARWHNFFSVVDNGLSGNSNDGPDLASLFAESLAYESSSETRASSNDEGQKTYTGTFDRRSGIDIESFGRMGLDHMLNVYRRTGHLAAKLDPLGLHFNDRSTIDKLLKKFKKDDLELEIDTPFPNLGKTKLKNIVAWLEDTYCNHIGNEHYYLVDELERLWLQNEIELNQDDYIPNTGEKLRIFEKLFQADYFEKFLAKKYVGKKRFSLEGAESLIPLMDRIIEHAGLFKMDRITIGMAHRGRLNVLVNVMEKPASLIFAEFDENYDPDTLDYADVKYHLGFSNNIMTHSGKELHLSLGFNPSHLEVVNPVVMGKVMAEQHYAGDEKGLRSMPILIHGDAAFAGQGVVAESLNLHSLDGYDVGGTMHILVNNQIGFTTLPNESRSTLYATDLAKGFQIPIFHVNADDPIACFKVVKLAMNYRQAFNKDVIIDLICYRRWGHNENDEPAFTQPLMYANIKKHPATVLIYEKTLLEDPEITAEDIDFIKKGKKAGLEASFERAKKKNVKMTVDTMGGMWSDYTTDAESEPSTKLLKKQLQVVSKAITTYPDSFTPNKKIVRFLDQRAKMYNGEIPIDWGFAEALAFGSILETGANIRLTGQDAQRGTFSHRHAVITDNVNGKTYVPLQNISEKTGLFRCHKLTTF